MPAEGSGRLSPASEEPLSSGPAHMCLEQKYGYFVPETFPHHTGCGTASSLMDIVIPEENMEVIRRLPEGSFQMVYVDPPFNTGRAREQMTPSPAQRQDGDRFSFAGSDPASARARLRRYDDVFEDYWEFLFPRLEEAWRLLAPTGTLYVHLDQREVHYAKVMLDIVFGRECFLNEIIWAYDYGAKTKRRWPNKHETILVYVKDPQNYYFSTEDVDREPYMAPGMAGAARTAQGKLPTDVWWHTIVSPTSREKTGYPTQKPTALLKRMVAASTARGDWVLDFFAGSGTAGDACQQLGRHCVLIDQNPDAVEVMAHRLAPESTRFMNVAPRSVVLTGTTDPVL